MKAHAFDAVLAMPGDRSSGGLPYVTKVDNMDHWPSTVTTDQFLDTMIAIVNRGFAGVKIELYSLSGDHSMVNFYFDEGSPEGRMAAELMDRARQGKKLSTEECLSIIERIYREQGLALPNQQTAGTSAGQKGISDDN